MKIYNRIKDSYENFIHNLNEPVKIFVCGPTLYDKVHLGHLKVIFFSDLIVRYLKFKGYKLEPILNLTDMDFKIIEKAKEENSSVLEVVNKYYEEVKESFKKLKLSSDFILVRPSEAIDKAIEITRELIEKRQAYFLEDGIFCDSSFSKNIGLLSKITKEEMREMILEPNIKKRNPTDFRIWIKIKDESFFYDTIFGKGFVGWHMQDYSVIEKYFNGTYDFHLGAKDLIYPHHEFILLLGEYYRGIYPIVKHFIHTGVITKNGEKMSKSLGNVIYLDKLLANYDSDDLRIYIFSKKYSEDVEFKVEDLEEAKRIKELIKNLNFKKSNMRTDKINKEILNYYNDFISNLDNDISINESLKAWINLSYLLRDHELDEEGIILAKNTYKTFSQITGILLDRFSEE
jgi:cysteinyl-tRNA synthetase